MRVLLIHAHPLADSFSAGLRAATQSALEAAGHEVDLCDLYAERFDPVLSAGERGRYHDPSRNRVGVEPYVARLLAAEALVLVFPVWCFGFPAILKGFFDRVFLPGVSMALGEGGPRPLLTHLRAVVSIATYGRKRHMAWWVGDPPRRVVTRYLRWFAAPRATVRHLALYDMNNATEDDRLRFAGRVRHKLPRLLARTSLLGRARLFSQAFAFSRG